MILLELVDHELHDREYNCQAMLKPHHLDNLQSWSVDHMRKRTLELMWQEYNLGKDGDEESLLRTSIKQSSQYTIKASYQSSGRRESLRCSRYMNPTEHVEDLLATGFDFRSVETAPTGLISLLRLQRVNTTSKDVITACPEIQEALYFRLPALAEQGLRFNHYLLCSYNSAKIKVSTHGQTCNITMQPLVPPSDEHHRLDFTFDQELPDVIVGSWQNMYAFQGFVNPVTITLKYKCQGCTKIAEIFSWDSSATFGAILAALMTVAGEIQRMPQYLDSNRVRSLSPRGRSPSRCEPKRLTDWLSGGPVKTVIEADSAC